MCNECTSKTCLILFTQRYSYSCARKNVGIANGGSNSTVAPFGRPLVQPVQFWCIDVSIGLVVCSTTAGTAESRIEMEPLQLRSDILVKCYAVNTVTNQLSPRSDVRLLFRCQFHTSALGSHSLEFSAADIDLESPAQGKRSLDGLRIEFNFSPTSVTARCKSTLSTTTARVYMPVFTSSFCCIFYLLITSAWPPTYAFC